MDDLPDVLTAKEIADYLNIPVWKLDKLIVEGYFPASPITPVLDSRTAIRRWYKESIRKYLGE